MALCEDCAFHKKKNKTKKKQQPCFAFLSPHIFFAVALLNVIAKITVF